MNLNTIKIGDKVRSFDFSHHRDISGKNAHYVEGVVVDIGNVLRMPGCTRYTIDVTARIWCGEREEDIDPRENLVYAPVNGTRTTMGRITDGVELL